MTVQSDAADPDSLRGSLTLLATLFACYATLSVVGVVLVKRWLAQAAVDVRSGDLFTAAVWGSAAGAAAYAVSFGLWTVISTRAPLSVAYPVAVGVTSFFTVIAGLVVFGERPTAVQLVGCAAVLLGIVLMSSGLRR